jgi:hypothetical protein
VDLLLEASSLVSLVSTLKAIAQIIINNNIKALAVAIYYASIYLSQNNISDPTSGLEVDTLFSGIIYNIGNGWQQPDVDALKNGFWNVKISGTNMVAGSQNDSGLYYNIGRGWIEVEMQSSFEVAISGLNMIASSSNISKNFKIINDVRSDLNTGVPGIFGKVDINNSAECIIGSDDGIFASWDSSLPRNLQSGYWDVALSDEGAIVGSQDDDGIMIYKTIYLEGGYKWNKHDCR